jgi:hypothetical protein
VEATGWAKKTVDWKAYAVAAVSAAIFIGFVWWAFMR